MHRGLRVWETLENSLFGILWRSIWRSISIYRSIHFFFPPSAQVLTLIPSVAADYANYYATHSDKHWWIGPTLIISLSVSHPLPRAYALSLSLSLSLSHLFLSFCSFLCTSMCSSLCLAFYHLFCHNVFFFFFFFFFFLFSSSFEAWEICRKVHVFTVRLSILSFHFIFFLFLLKKQDYVPDGIIISDAIAEKILKKCWTNSDPFMFTEVKLKNRQKIFGAHKLGRGKE